MLPAVLPLPSKALPKAGFSCVPSAGSQWTPELEGLQLDLVLLCLP